MVWHLEDRTPRHAHPASAAWASTFHTDVVLVDEDPSPVLPAPSSSDRPPTTSPNDPDVIVLDTPPQQHSARHSPRETIFLDDSPRKRRRRDTPSPPANTHQDPSHVIVVDDDDNEIEPQQTQHQPLLPHPSHLFQVLDSPSPPVPTRYRLTSSSALPPSPLRRLSDSSDDIIETAAAGPRLAAPLPPPNVPRLCIPSSDLFDVQSFHQPLDSDSPEPPASTLPLLQPPNRRSMPMPPLGALAASASNSASHHPAAASGSSARNNPLLSPLLSPLEIDIPDVIVPERVSRVASAGAGAGPSSAVASDRRTARDARSALRREQLHEMSRTFSGYLTDYNAIHLLNGRDVMAPTDHRERHSQPQPPLPGSRSHRMNPAVHPFSRRRPFHQVPRSSVRWSGLHGLRSASSSQPTFDTSPAADQVNAGESGGRVLMDSSGGRMRFDEADEHNLFDRFDRTGLHVYSRRRESLRRGIGRTSTTQAAALAGFPPRPMHHAMRSNASRGRRTVGEAATIRGSGSRRRSNSGYLPGNMSGLYALVRSPPFELPLHAERLDYEHLIRLDEQLMRDKNRAEKAQIEALPLSKATVEDKEIRCCVCMCDVEEGEELRVLPCSHKYHRKCIDEWLTYNGCCPVDKKRIAPPRSRRRCSMHRD